MSYYDNYRKYMNDNADNHEPTYNTNQENTQQEAHSQESATFSKSGSGGTGDDGGQQPKKKRPATAAIVASVLAGGMLLGGAVGWNASQNREATLYKDAGPKEAAMQKSDQANNIDQSANNTTQIDTVSDPNKAFSIEEFTKKLDGSGKNSKTASEIYKEVNPSIVSVETKYTLRQGNRSAETTGAGSGIIISDDGYVLTNCHVVESSDSISITTSDGEKHDVELIGIDSQTDLAVLKFDNSNKTYTAAPLGNSSTVEIGEMVVAIGNPLGELANSLSIGAISAAERTIEMDNGSMTFLQTTAAISPGNSGGALINSYGEVIGVTTAKSTGSGVEGIGYAIPINDAKVVIEELINNGYVTGRPMLGINVEVVDDEVAQVYNMPEGLYITAVGEGSSAAESGLKVGDIIVKFNGTDVKDRDELNEAKNACKPGDTVEVEFFRKGERQKVSLTLGEQKPEVATSNESIEQQQPEAQFPGSGQQQPQNPFGDSGNYEYYYDNGSGDSQAIEEFFRSFFG